MKKTFAALAFLLVFSVSSTAALAQDKTTPSAGEIMFDLVFTRPLGIVAIAAGTAVFVVGLPFSLPARSVKLTADKLITEPFEFTFKRSVGEIRE